MNLSKIQATSEKMPLWLKQVFSRLLSVLGVILGWQLDSVANIAGFASVDDARIPDGSKKVVRTLWDTFTLDKTSTATVDGITVVATMSATGRWVRDLQPNVSRWSNQATWFIDADNGNDENDGSTDATELATWAEFRRRVEPGGVLVAMTVTIETDLPASDVLDLDTFGETLTIVGVPTVTYTGTINTWTPANGPGNTPPLLNDAGWTIADHLYDHVRFTSGDAATMGCWILEDKTGNSARMSFVSSLTAGWPSDATPLAGDTFVVETFPEVTFSDVRYDGNIVLTRLQFADWETSGLGDFKSFHVNDVVMVACQVVMSCYLDCTLTDCLGGFFARGRSISLYAGAYSKFDVSDRNAYTYNSATPVVIDISIPTPSGISLGLGAVLYSLADIWLYGNTGTFSFGLANEKSYIHMEGRFRGEVTATGVGRLLTLLDESQLFTTNLDHTVTEATVLQPDTTRLELNVRNSYGGAIGRVQVMSQTYGEEDLTAAAATETLDLGYELPAHSRIVGVEMYGFAPFTGGTITDFTVDIGSSNDPAALIDGANLFAGAVDDGPSAMPQGIRPNKLFDAGVQLQAKFDCASDDVADATTGDVTIDVYYTVETA